MQILKQHHLSITEPGFEPASHWLHLWHPKTWQAQARPWMSACPPPPDTPHKGQRRRGRWLPRIWAEDPRRGTFRGWKGWHMVGEQGPCLGGRSLRPAPGGVRLKALSGLP